MNAFHSSLCCRGCRGPYTRVRAIHSSLPLLKGNSDWDRFRRRVAAGTGRMKQDINSLMSRTGGSSGNSAASHFRRELDNMQRDMSLFRMSLKNGSYRNINPVDALMYLDVALFALTHLFPQLQPLFVVYGVRHPTAFLLSGFCSPSAIQLLFDLAIVYLMMRPMASWMDQRQMVTLWVGGTLLGSLMVASMGVPYMGISAGFGAFMATYFTQGNLGLVRLPFGNQYPAQTLFMVFTGFQAMMFLLGSPSAAAFLGGALFSVLSHYFRK
eukprot:NODE_2610_length_894_cov_65.879290_g2146_i0.p1 GENE.NODE_2610_length_894_cov_65.879290_g2146_i0~~NODE_2610_length_894_cov_65.879290_g2146_i0.p1  ORF type:complete len:269 (-),score=57.81 NODE_2610_length_894_cov_65.879290_g2146_i0:29-835(-)